jgi:hypothetical protein
MPNESQRCRCCCERGAAPLSNDSAQSGAAAFFASGPLSRPLNEADDLLIARALRLSSAVPRRHPSVDIVSDHFLLHGVLF